VPSSAASLLTLDNAERLLVGGSFLGAADSRKEKGGRVVGLRVLECPRTTVVVPGSGEKFELPSKFHLVNSVAQLKKQDWDRVVGVFAMGKAWQFKDWGAQWSEPGYLFTHCRGFHLHYDDTQVPTEAMTWNVARLELSRTSRHFDKLIMERFWQEIGTFMLHNKPEMGEMV